MAQLPTISSNPSPTPPRNPSPGQTSVDWGLDASVGLRRPMADPEEIRRRLSPVRAYPAGDDPRLQAGSIIESSEGKVSDPGKFVIPSWIRGWYRPRHLTPAGLLALEALAPKGSGIRGHPTTVISTLQDRRDALALRYTCWDLVERGHAVEVLGSYINVYHTEKLPSLESRLRRIFRGDDPVVEGESILAWLSIAGQMTVDQILSLEPERWIEQLGTLLALEEAGLVERLRVRLGAGSLQVCRLTRGGWKCAKGSVAHLPSFGLGPHFGPHLETTLICTDQSAGREAWHPLVVVDAMGWFLHAQASQKVGLAEIVTEGALVRDQGSGPGAWRPDFEVRPQGGPHFGVEVIGTGHDYRSKSRMKAPRRSPYYRTFSSADKSPSLAIHIAIGR